MKKIFDYRSPSEHYHNSEAFLWCCDQRFEEVRHTFAQAGTFHMPDPILVPGGVKPLVTPKEPRDREFVLEQIEVLMGHGFTTLYAMAHMNCAACDGNNDRAFYEDMLKKAGEIIRNRIPGLNVRLIFADFDGLYEV
ncbi:MAG: hypothetical protein ABSE18_03990 [Minisyncoccia bacterium]|jgi:hypothetical protein